MTPERRTISVRGLVQGVGFRPYVHALATRHALGGFVRNDASGVSIEVEGESRSLERFVDELPHAAPEAARIDALSWRPAPARGDVEFRIAPSDAVRRSLPLFTADLATCDACLRELFDPADRRYRYPFLNCTECGPRLTIVEGAPYDRERTTMSAFAMCGRCRDEYERPSDRRFHAQPNACADCGPSLAAPLDDFVRTIASGGIGAVKGLGGYHVVCDGSSDEAVSRLRARKARDEKPFAVMAADLERARELAVLGARDEVLLSSRARPIVLVRRRVGARLAAKVAPGCPDVGIMLPYTPLHFLLMEHFASRPLVMTSANRSDEPIVHREDDLGRLDGIPDVVLSHDRPIRVRCDDSVIRSVLDERLPLRRSRGFAPEPIPLPRVASKRILAVGGHLKNTFALGVGEHAIVSHHIGDLDELRALDAFENDVALYEELFDFEPEAIVHDLHPDYASTRYAKARAEAASLPVVSVQHHHAHVAACMAENGLDGSVIGVAFDGTGFGTDGTIWGGEFLVADTASFERAAHFRPVALPGGDRAAKEPWRMALSHRLDAGLEPPSDVNATVVNMIRKNVNAPRTSSVGRLFDAVSSLIGVRHRASYEGQAAMELEWLCAGRLEASGYPAELDTRALIRSVIEDRKRGVAPESIARRFHRTVVDIITNVCREIRDTHGLERVVLTGGVFQNVLLLESSVPVLEAEGFRVFRHRLVPPNDGGLSLGQIAVASERLACA